MAFVPRSELDARMSRLRQRLDAAVPEWRAALVMGKVNLYYLTGTMPSGALVIPRDALIPESEGSERVGVYVVREGKARRAAIRVGDSRDGLVWVREGLGEGDLVITEIGPSLKEGMAVRVSR